MRENYMREVPHEWFFLHVEVSENLLAVPASNQLDDVSVETRAEEGNGTSGAEGEGRHILGLES